MNAPADLASLYHSWKDEPDPAKRADCAQQVVDAIVHCGDDQLGRIADDLTRDGRPERDLTPPAARSVPLTALVSLQGAHSSGDDDFPPAPVFRRIADDRFEAWTSAEGWLFNARGRLLTHVTVPRRDGDGREWFGAFLPDGAWITTDLWAEDKQLNAFDAHGKWLWELQGADILKQMPRTASPDDADTPAKPILDWARADRIGRGWLVSVGENMDTTCALVAEDKSVAALPAGQGEWSLVQPRAMGVRGFYTDLFIDSDDGNATLHRGEAGHGMYVGWPNYSLTPGTWTRVLRSGDWRFGFWPRSHAVFAETDDYTLAQTHRVWFFDAAGKYAGEIPGMELGDSATGGGLLIKSPDDSVATVLPGQAGPAPTAARVFTWSDGSHAIPLALYDDLHLGFFLRGPGINGPGDDGRRARTAADIVLAKWRP